MNVKTVFWFCICKDNFKTKIELVGLAKLLYWKHHNWGKRIICMCIEYLLHERSLSLLAQCVCHSKNSYQLLQSLWKSKWHFKCFSKISSLWTHSSVTLHGEARSTNEPKLAESRLRSGESGIAPPPRAQQTAEVQVELLGTWDAFFPVTLARLWLLLQSDYQHLAKN